MNDETAAELVGVLGSIGATLVRLAQAEETRNIILERDLIDRKAAWRESEERSNAALERLLDTEPGGTE